MTTTTIPRNQYKTWLMLGIFVLILMAVEAILVYRVYAVNFPGTADFFARWYGARELVSHNRNPFDRAIELEAQVIMFGRHTESDEDQVNFAYPLYTIYLFWPLTFTSYPWAQAIWMVTLQFALLASALLLFQVVGWRPPPWLFILTLFWSIFFYAGARAIMLGQFSVLVALCLWLSVWALLNGYEGLAGLVLPLTTVKPQMVFLVIPFLLLWAWRQKQWRFILTAAISMGALFFSSLIWVPDWPLRFFSTLSAYADYVGFGSPLENMTARFAPTIADELNTGISLLLGLFLLWQWWQTLAYQPTQLLWALNWTLLISNLIAFRSATANHVILYLSLFILFKRLASVSGQSNWLVFFSQIAITIMLWVLFATTIDTTRGSNFEAIFMHGFLPTLLICYYLIDGRALFKATPQIKPL